MAAISNLLLPVTHLNIHNNLIASVVTVRAWAMFSLRNAILIHKLKQQNINGYVEDSPFPVWRYDVYLAHFSYYPNTHDEVPFKSWTCEFRQL